VKTKHPPQNRLPENINALIVGGGREKLEMGFRIIGEWNYHG
jgi:hypothetical protein